MAKVQYPNPKFWKAKDNINWKKQGENLMEVMGIFGDMLKDTDWKAFGKGAIEGCKADIERIKGEYKDFMALDNAEKWDRVVNGALPIYSVLIAQSCQTLCDPIDCCPPGFSVHGIL